MSSSPSTAVPVTQKALILDTPGTNGQFSVHTDADIESPGPGELQIRVISAALNPVDWKTKLYDDGRIISDGYPAVLGSDIAGDVVRLGEGVNDFEIGDRVFCQSEFKKRRGGFQQYVVAHASRVAKIPANITYDGAATLPMALTTAYSGLFSAFPTGLGLDPSCLQDASKRKEYEQKPILVLGGSSSVGQFVLQLARLAGFSPIITTSSLHNSTSVEQLGATHVLDRQLSQEALKSAISRITSQPITLVYDSVGTAETQQIAMECLAPGGRAIVVDIPSVKSTEDKEVGMAIAAVHLPHNVGLLEPFYHDVVYGLLESGALVPNRVEVLPGGLGGIVDGLKRLEADQVSRLKLVARPQES